MNTTKKQSLCIPRIDSSVTREYIFDTFCKLKIGYIENILEIPLRNDTKHKRVIIKIRWNENNKLSENIKSRLDNEETIKVVHEMPWYWKVVSTHQK